MSASPGDGADPPRRPGAGPGAGAGAGARTAEAEEEAEQTGADDRGEASRTAAGTRGGRSGRRVSWQKLVLLPALLALILLITWLWFDDADLDPIARNSLADDNVWLRFKEHIYLTAVSTFFVLIIAIPLGIALTRRQLRRAAPYAMAVANLGQAVPALGLLVLLVFWIGIGADTAIVGIVIYAVLPVLANTMAGLRGIDPSLVEAAKGIGMSSWGVLGKVELPLAVPLILAGVRTALVLNVGTATLATFGGGGGLGDLIAAGITNQRMPVLVLGSVLTVVLALFVDWLASLAELLLRPRGLEATT